MFLVTKYTPSVVRVYRFRLYPTRSQCEALVIQRDLLRRFYNAALEQRMGAWRAQHKSLNYYDQAAEIAAVKDECPEYAKVHTHLLQDVLKRLDRAFRAFFRRLKAGQKPGFPRFKGRDRYNTFSFQDAAHGNGAAFVAGGKRLRVAGVGNVKIKLHREQEGVLKTIGVTLDGDGHWYTLITRDVEPESLPATGQEIGIDLGLHSFIATSDGEPVPNPRHLETARIRMERAQRKASRRVIGSTRRRRARRELAAAHAHIRNTRRDFHHKTARDLVRRFDFISIEDLNIHGMARGLLAKSVNDAAWAQFISILCAKAEEAGREVVKVNPCGTTQLCSQCGCNVPKDLSVRVHECPQCEYTVDRDVNAARNILRLGRSLRRAAPNGDRQDPRSPCLAF
jgi:putative transposase